MPLSELTALERAVDAIAARAGLPLEVVLGGDFTSTGSWSRSTTDQAPLPVTCRRALAPRPPRGAARTRPGAGRPGAWMTPLFAQREGLTRGLKGR